MNACDKCATIIPDELTQWHMATPICGQCWNAIENMECESCADTVGVLDGYCRDCSQVMHLDMCLHCGQTDRLVNVWGECGQCESDQYSRHRFDKA